MSLEETKEKLEWRKRVFEWEHKISYGIENQNGMTHIHDKEVNKITEWYLLHYIINPPKLTKYLNIYYSSILHVCMNTRKGKATFKNFRILLDSGCSSTIVIGRLVKKLHSDKYAVMQWSTQYGNITTNIKVKVYFTLPVLSSTNVVTCKWHVDESTKGRYYMTLRRYLLT